MRHPVLCITIEYNLTEGKYCRWWKDQIWQEFKLSHFCPQSALYFIFPNSLCVSSLTRCALGSFRPSLLDRKGTFKLTYIVELLSLCTKVRAKLRRKSKRASE